MTPMLMGHACAYPTCKEVVRSKYCQQHKHIQSDVSRGTRGTTSQQGYGTVWQKVRKRQLLNYPLCYDCKAKGIIKPAKEAHHILELKRGGTNEDDNLQSLCKSCHSKHTRMAQDAIGVDQRVHIEDNHPEGRGGLNLASLEPSERELKLCIWSQNYE